jgi:HEAT repeat protein
MDSPELDPRLQPTPDYGTLGPGADAKPRQSPKGRKQNARTLLAMVAGILLALPILFFRSGAASGAWEQIESVLGLQGKPEPASPAILSEHEIESLDKASPQMQAQSLLERAVNHYEGATDQIAQRVDGWRGHLKRTQKLESLVTAGLNSNDLRVRATAIEVDLAALNISKTPESMDTAMSQAESSDKQVKVWGLWIMGLLANRGVEPQRAEQTLLNYTRDSDENTRHWAVEGLAYLGSDSTIEPLLQIMHDDSSPLVRERAACSLAQSGMLNQEQRRRAIPRLLDYSEDASLDAQTRSWAFQALRDITGQGLPNDTAAWRNWYTNR